MLSSILFQMNPKTKMFGYLSPEIQVMEITGQGVLCLSGPDTTETKPGGLI